MREISAPFRVEPSLRLLVDRLGVADRVEFVGAVDDTAPHLRAADVVVVPSKWDAQSLVLLEAMACGAPIVATRVPGVTAVQDVGVIVEDHAVIGGQVGIGDKARIESGAVLGSGCGILTSKIVRAVGSFASPASWAW